VGVPGLGRIVYPKPEPRGFDRLEYLSRWFSTVEIDATFYRPFGADVAARWCERIAAVPCFRFASKVWRRLTHERDEACSADEVRAALDRLHAEGRLGAALLQFPWSFKRGRSGCAASSARSPAFRSCWRCASRRSPSRLDRRWRRSGHHPACRSRSMPGIPINRLHENRSPARQ
jgi:uncharacterized protein YecE (DUF72 family)